MSADAAVLAGRAAAEALMVDACTVTAEGVAVFDEATGKWEPASRATVYVGRCRVQVPNVAETHPDAGAREWTVQAAIIQLPVVTSTGVGVGHSVVIDECALDPSLVGRAFVVSALHHKTHATARRLRCEEVTQ